jgi:YVTN family beta-propeller protein
VAGSSSRGQHLRRGLFFAVALAALLLALSSTSALARDAYVANEGTSDLSVFDTQTNQLVGSPIKVGTGPFAVAITPNGTTAYTANFDDDTVSVINTETKQGVGSPITVGAEPAAIAITPDGRFG